MNQIAALDFMDGTFDTDVANTRSAYNALNATQQGLVTNYALLEEAEAGIVTDEATFATAIANADKLFLANDISLGSTVAIDQEVLINGNGKTLTSTVDPINGLTHNTSVVVSANNVEITNLTVDANATTPGTWQTPARFGMQVYNATGVKLTDVTLKNGQAGLLVNARLSDASVTGTGINTDGNGFGGIEIFADATFTSTLTLTEPQMHTTSNPAIWSEGAGTTNVVVSQEWYDKFLAGQSYSINGNNITVPTGQTHWKRVYM
ncbi:hypothetical protein DV702_16685 [Sporosarcina sp. PTS2304]|uniref:hypothetical protein n=1 Tax=Sporosarcina sp. PTS2304 TaxID=2283194 RepID=UPI000E0DF192|nr:hypothetical protein [Sporosarcina sp. PTS2304]AXI01213.1 hypothetical protein DV702_16685 [Sporosarcina sp. PTS2304]